MKITYGGVACGTGTVFNITGFHYFEKSYESLSVSFDVLVQNDVLATFLANCATLETAYRTKNSDLTITIGGSSHTTVTHAADTGFNGRATCVKAGQLGDSNNSRFYTCSVTVQLPADEAGKNSRQDSSYRLSADDAGIQSLEVSAVYTATGGTAALAQAQAQFPGYASGLQPSGDWDEAALISYEPDDENKVCSCFVSYREIKHNQSAGTANDTSLVGEEISVLTQRTSSSSDQGSNAAPLVTVRVTFSTAVRVASTTDLQNKWTSIRAYLKTVAETQSGVSGLTVIEENPSPSPSLNRLNGSITLVGADGSSLLLSQTLVATAESTGKQFVPVANGDPLGADVHDGPQVHTLIVQSTVLELDNAGAGSDESFAAFRDAVQAAESKGYIKTLTEKPLDVRFEHTGMRFSTRMALRRRQQKVTLRKVNQANTTEASSGGGSGVTRTRGSDWILG